MGIIDRELRELPQSLREMDMPAPTPNAPQELPTPTHRLGALDLPALPGQQPPEGQEAQRHRTTKLGRAKLGRIRGVDPATAPDDLRCAIDGRVLGAPLRSPYGHAFERSTLEEW